LRRIVADPLFPPSPLYNSVAEIWFYHIAAVYPGRAVRVPGPHSIIGAHPGARLTNHWEKLGVASLAVMEAFVRHCPETSGPAVARRMVGERAFGAWRRLPRDFSPAFGERLLAVWRKLAGEPSPALGGRQFQVVAKWLGPERAGKLLRRFQAAPYASCRTMSDGDFQRLLEKLPPS
jgi:hypothetical protein